MTFGSGYDDLRAPDAWRERAACRGMDPALFFPEQGEHTDEAKAVCDGCCVREFCLEDGVAERHGIWGGLSERQRRRLGRRRLTALQRLRMERDERVRHLTDRGYSVAVVAGNVGVSEHVVHDILARLGIPSPGAERHWADEEFYGRKQHRYKANSEGVA